MKKQNLLFILIILFLLLSLREGAKGQTLVDAQQKIKSRNSFDPTFPSRKKMYAGFITTYSVITPPPVLIADLTFGVSDKISMGITAGTTGAIALYGIKINAILFERDRLKLMFRMTSVYYPQRDGKFLFDRAPKYVMPWMLSMGVIDFEKTLRNNIRWSFGFGILETHCVDDMKHWFRHSSEFHHIDYPDFFQTIQSSISIPLSARVTVRPEVFCVLKGGHLIEREKFKVPFPVNPYLNLIIRLSREN